MTGIPYVVNVQSFRSDGSTAVPNTFVVLRNNSTDESITSVSDSNGQVIFNLLELPNDYSDQDSITVRSAGSGWFQSETFSVNISSGSNTIILTMVDIGINLDTLTEDIWDIIHSAVNSNNTLVNDITFVGSVFPKKFVENAGGLPFLIIHKPKVTEEHLTFKKKRFNVNVEIGVYTNSAAKLKEVENLLRKTMNQSQFLFIGENLVHMLIDSDDATNETRGTQAIHNTTLLFTWLWLGGGKISRY